MSKLLKIGMAQINSTMGDFEGNMQKVIQRIQEARSSKVELLVFPELTMIGYPPLDLIFNKEFIHRNLSALEQVAKQTVADLAVVIGYIDKKENLLYNSAAILQDGRLFAKRHKTLLPNYNVFNEKKYFTPAQNNMPIAMSINDKKFSLGLEICEDLWDQDAEIKVTENLVKEGAELIVNISASPFEIGKREVRENILLEKVKKISKPIVLVNFTGGQAELVFAGNSQAFGSDGSLVGYGREFQESQNTFSIELQTGLGNSVAAPNFTEEKSLHKALTLGVHDYFRKSGFSQAVIGLSGGVDSALVACIAAEALGAENVICVAMPTNYTSASSNDDAKKLAENLCVNFETIPIEDLRNSYAKSLANIFRNTSEDITEENIQSRIRGNILMAIANKKNALVLNTGNKTELALGYCTMYGDMCGALGVIADVNKTQVYQLCEYINNKAGQEIIPHRIIERQPSAELKDGQVDPFDYNIVSPLVDMVIVEGKSREDLLEMGHSAEIVDDILRRIHFNEYKRAQAPPAIKVSKKAFGIGRRFPIVNKFLEF